jgi:hypothetical protein
VDSALDVSVASHTDHAVSEPDQKLTDADIAKGDACSLAEGSGKVTVKREVNSSADMGHEAAGHTEDTKEEQQRGDREGESVVPINPLSTDVISETGLVTLDVASGDDNYYGGLYGDRCPNCFTLYAVVKLFCRYI